MQALPPARIRPGLDAAGPLGQLADVPRHTSSWSLVSSRHTATGRSGPHTATRSSRSRCDPVGGLEDDYGAVRLGGDGGQALGPWRPVRGTKPSKHQRSVAKPETTRAANAADGPGDGLHGDARGQGRPHQPAPRVAHQGVPASVTRAMVAPAFRRSTAVAVLAASLKRWWATRRGPAMEAWLSSFRVRRVSSQ